MLTANSINNNDSKKQEDNQEAPLERVEEMYNAGVHFSYSKSSLHPKMRPYLFGARNNVEIFNLEKVYFCLEDACNFLKELGSAGKQILLVSTKPEASDILKDAGEKAGLPYVADRWPAGALTNFKMIKSRIDRFEDLKNKKEAKEFLKLSKKEASRMEKKLAKLEAKFSGLKLLKDLPAAMLVIDPKKEKTAVLEAKKIKIPIAAVLNSDCDPTNIDYPVPANDASTASVQYLLGKLLTAYKEGQENRHEAQSTKPETNSNDKNSKPKAQI